MKVMTWNVNRFDGGAWDWFKENRDLPMDNRKEYANKIIEKLRELIKTKEDIAILQEVPYRDFDWKDEWIIWKKLFSGFKVMLWFDDEPQRDDFNYMFSKNVTIAVANEGCDWNIRPFDKRKIRFKKTKDKKGKEYWDYTNRYIELENGKESILGIHVSDSVDQWEKIHSAADNSEFSIIAGDFNINDLLYPERNELKHLEKKYKRLIDNEVITHNQAVSSLDNVFVNTKICLEVKSVFVLDYCFVSESDEKEPKKRYSDHNICVCELY